MAGEILLDRKTEEIVSEKEQGPLQTLEEKVGDLLNEFQDLKKERDKMAWHSMRRRRGWTAWRKNWKFFLRRERR